eukprot:CAMPEP_0117066928 /NCGR_PEP_ID=MMETSP0472-20121206/46829_1 /TAXON_ID=693140 ORGANISM="Tiarina fusus, Strain LIS" /NCGR_SAMPLE_ID=MMETSP0472 /ASSEMBLY_ACC=CAM_ASM_000603 /LENGTH=171 /DNA_ID=CAMNT_0004788229 /DNA_START=9 /DNA_END=521 /DNA_ORIENTATION=-
MLEVHNQDNRIYFAGAVKDINDVLEVNPSVNASNPSESGVSKPRETDYQVNNQLISVVTKSIDFSVSDASMEDDRVYAPLREYSSDEEDENEENKIEDKREYVPLYHWNETNESWEIFVAPSKPERCINDDGLFGITLNVWNSEKWQEARTKSLQNFLHQHSADFVCLQEV